MKLSEYKSYDELPLFLSSAQAPHPSLPAKAESSFAPLCLLSPQSQRAALRGPLVFPCSKWAAGWWFPRKNLWSGWSGTLEVMLIEETSSPHRLAQA